MMQEKQTTSSGTGTLGKVLAILDVIAASREPLRFIDLLNRMGQPRGTLHRQLSHLLEEDFITVNEAGTYELGLRLLNLASVTWSRNSLRAVAEPFLRDLQAKTGETVHLAVLRDARVVYLDKVEGRQSVRMYSQIGNASPLYCTGVGKAMLSALPDEQVSRLAHSIEYRRYTEHTLTSAEALIAEVGLIREQGYAEDREEHEPGIRCVAAPVLGANGQLRCGVSATVPVFRLAEGQLDQWKVWVVDAARSISSGLIMQLGPRA